MRRSTLPRRWRAPHAFALAWVLGCAAVFGAGQNPGAAEEEGWQPYSGLFPNQGPGYDLLLVRDAVTGRPVAGAQVEARWEAAYENGAWAPLDSGGTTDEHGLFWQPRAEGGGSRHWEVRAPGYAPAHEYTTEALDEEIHLEPAVPHHGRIVDAAGRPVAGVTVAWKVGCAHAPFHGSAVTDANGRFVLPDCPEDPDIGTVAGPGIAFDPYNVNVAPVWAVAPLTVALPGIDVVGRILPPHGPWPLTLASRQEERGPLLAVASDGAFRMSNVEPDTTLELWDFVPPGSPADTPRPFQKQPLEIDLEAWTPGAPVLLDPSRPSAPEPLCRVRVWLSGAPADDEQALALHFDRVDGRRFTRLIDLPTQADDEPLEVPAGTYVVRLDAPFARYHAEAVHFLVDPRVETTTLVLPVRPCERLLLPYGDARLARELGIRPEDLGDCALFVAAREPLSGAWRLQTSTLAAQDASPIAIVPGCEAAPWACGPFGTIRFHLLEAREGTRAVSWSIEPGGALDVTGVAPDEKVELGFVHVVTATFQRGEGRLRVRVGWPGKHVLHVDWNAVAMEMLPFAVGSDPRSVAAADLRTRPAPTDVLEVRMPVGLPAFEAFERPEIDVRRLDGPGEGLAWLRQDAYIDSHSAGATLRVTHPLLGRGARVNLRLALPWEVMEDGQATPPELEFAPQHVALGAAGPFAHDIPAGGVDLRVRLAAPSADAKVSVLVDGRIYAPRPSANGEGLLRLRGVPAGPCSLVVTARGHQGRQLTITRATDEVRVLEVELPASR